MYFISLTSSKLIEVGIIIKTRESIDFRPKVDFKALARML